METLEDGARAGEFYRNLILSEAFQSPSLSSNPIMFVLCRYSQPPIDLTLRMGFVQLMIDARVTSTMTWGEAQSVLETDAGSWRFISVRGHFFSTNFRGNFSVAT